MTLLKRNDGGMLSFRPRLNDYFDSDRFFFDNMWNGETVPSVNIIENEKGYDIELAAPGLKKNDFKVKLESGMLTISAEKREEKEEKTRNYTRQEFRYNTFTRSFTLPENVKEDDVRARYEDGVLKLHIAKKDVEAVKVKEVPIN